MNRIRLISALFLLSLIGCTPEPYSVKVGFANGSTGGAHITDTMVITTVSGGKADFAMGAIDGPLGALASGGRMDPPAHIEGYWGKEDDSDDGFESYHHISMDVPSNAEAKMKLMDTYYENFDNPYGRMSVVVDGARVRIYYTKSCYAIRMDCTPKEDIDPNGWVVKSASGGTDAVLLFDGVGETSSTPYPNTHFSRLAERRKRGLEY